MSNSKEADWYIPKPEGDFYQTIFDKDNLDASEENISLLKKIFKNSKNRYLTFGILPFNLNRKILHNTILCFSTYVKYENEFELLKNIENNIETINNYINKNQKHINKTSEKIEKDISIKYDLYKSNKLNTKSEEYKDFETFKKLLKKENIKYNDEDLLFLISSKYKKIETNKFIKNKIFEYARKNKKILNITFNEKEDKNIALITGAPASGKSNLVDIYKQLIFSEKDFSEVIKINPDYYKELLLNSNNLDNKIHFGSFTHEESAIINDMIFEEWIEKQSNNKHSHLLIDTSNASSWYINKLQKANKNANLDIFTITVNTLVALDRSYERGKEKKRFVPTELLLTRHKEQTNILINNIKNYNNIPIMIFSNDVNKGQKPKKSIIKEANSSIIEIYDMKSAVEFWNKQYLNTDAVNEEELQPHEDSYDKALIGFAKGAEKEVHIYDKKGEKIIAKAHENNIEVINKEEFNSIIQDAGLDKHLEAQNQELSKPIIVNPVEQNADILTDMNKRFLKNIKITQLLKALEKNKIAEENSRQQAQQIQNNPNSKDKQRER